MPTPTIVAEELVPGVNMHRAEVTSGDHHGAQIESRPEYKPDKYNANPASVSVRASYKDTESLERLMFVEHGSSTERVAGVSRHGGNNYTITDAKKIEALAKNLGVPADAIGSISYSSNHGKVNELSIEYKRGLSPEVIKQHNNALALKMEEAEVMPRGTAHQLGKEGITTPRPIDMDLGSAGRGNLPDDNGVQAFRVPPEQSPSGVGVTIKPQPNGNVEVVFGRDVSVDGPGGKIHRFVSREEAAAANRLAEKLGIKLPEAFGHGTSGMGVSLTVPAANVPQALERLEAAQVIPTGVAAEVAGAHAKGEITFDQRPHAGNDNRPMRQAAGAETRVGSGHQGARVPAGIAPAARRVAGAALKVLPLVGSAYALEEAARGMFDANKAHAAGRLSDEQMAALAAGHAASLAPAMIGEAAGLAALEAQKKLGVPQEFQTETLLSVLRDLDGDPERLRKAIPAEWKHDMPDSMRPLIEATNTLRAAEAGVDAAAAGKGNDAQYASAVDALIAAEKGFAGAIRDFRKQGGPQAIATAIANAETPTPQPAVAPTTPSPQPAPAQEPTTAPAIAQNGGIPADVAALARAAAAPVNDRMREMAGKAPVRPEQQVAGVEIAPRGGAVRA